MHKKNNAERYLTLKEVCKDFSFLELEPTDIVYLINARLGGLHFYRQQGHKKIPIEATCAINAELSTDEKVTYHDQNEHENNDLEFSIYKDESSYAIKEKTFKLVYNEELKEWKLIYKNSWGQRINVNALNLERCRLDDWLNGYTLSSIKKFDSLYVAVTSIYQDCLNQQRKLCFKCIPKGINIKQEDHNKIFEPEENLIMFVYDEATASWTVIYKNDCERIKQINVSKLSGAKVLKDLLQKENAIDLSHEYSSLIGIYKGSLQETCLAVIGGNYAREKCLNYKDVFILKDEIYDQLVQKFRSELTIQATHFIQFINNCCSEIKSALGGCVKEEVYNFTRKGVLSVKVVRALLRTYFLLSKRFLQTAPLVDKAKDEVEAILKELPLTDTISFKEMAEWINAHCEDIRHLMISEEQSQELQKLLLNESNDHSKRNWFSHKRGFIASLLWYLNIITTAIARKKPSCKYDTLTELSSRDQRSSQAILESLLEQKAELRVLIDSSSLVIDCHQSTAYPPFLGFYEKKDIETKLRESTYYKLRVIDPRTRTSFNYWESLRKRGELDRTKARLNHDRDFFILLEIPEEEDPFGLIRAYGFSVYAENIKIILADIRVPTNEREKLDNIFNSPASIRIKENNAIKTVVQKNTQNAFRKLCEHEYKKLTHDGNTYISNEKFWEHLKRLSESGSFHPVLMEVTEWDDPEATITYKTFKKSEKVIQRPRFETVLSEIRNPKVI